MNVLPLGYFPLFHGYTLLVVYIATLIVLPFAGLFYSIRDFRETTKELKPPDKITAVRAWFILFRKDDYILIWCFLAGCGFVLYGGASLFLVRGMAEIVYAVIMVVFGAALGIYAERTCEWFR